MQLSRVLAVPGLRSPAYPGWRAGVSTAFTVVVGKPQLWLLGALAFCLRGGIVLLVLPIIALPTPVEMRLLLGDLLGSAGFTDRFWGLAAGASVAAALITATVLLILARIELSAFKILARDREVADRLGVDTDRVGRGDGDGALPGLFAVQVVTCLALLVATVPLAEEAARAAFAEVVRPTSAAPIHERVLATLGSEIALFLAALVLIEMFSAVLTREVLVRRAAVDGARLEGVRWVVSALRNAMIRPFRVPGRTVATAVSGWIISAALVAPAVGAIALAWAAVRGAFLASISFADLDDGVPLLLVAVGLAATLILGMTLGGIASALRAAMWSVERLR